MSYGTTPRSIKLPQLLVPKCHIDSRGQFSEIFHEGRLHDNGITARFKQDNLSVSRRAATLRGLHFQLPPAAQAKLITVVKGRVLDVALDVRRGSPTYGEYVATELCSQTMHQLYVPVGFAHGFLTLEDDVVVMYKVSDYYSPKHDSGIRWNDPDVAVDWPKLADKVTISDKDRGLQLLSEFDSPFAYDGQPLAPLSIVEIG